MNAETQAALDAYWRRVHAIPNPRKEHRSIVALQREHFRPPTEVEANQEAPRQLALAYASAARYAASLSSRALARASMSDSRFVAASSRAVTCQILLTRLGCS